MKFFLFFLFTSILISINYVSADQKIVFIDMDRLISDSKPGSSVFDQLNDINKKNLLYLKKEENKFKEKEKKLISQKNIISEDDFKNKVDELKLEVKDYNQNRKKMIEKFNRLRVENTNNLLKLVNPIIVKYSDENNISIIIQKKNLIIGKTDLDITDKIINIINNQIKNFKVK